MSTNTAVAVIPADFQLPAHLQTPDAAAAIAAANAAAAGGIKGGSFPRLSKKGSKFHLIDGDEIVTLMEPPTQAGAPSLPKMLLQVVVVAANPGISKTYYEKDFNESDAGHEPDCKSSNGITPDSTVAQPKHNNCAQCPMNQWGSKISKMSGKETKACTDMKQLVILPRGDLAHKAVGLALTPSELKDWGNYVKALTGRGVPVNAVWTNLTFDANATHPKLVFSFAGVLTADEYAQVLERAKGDDVKTIIQPTAGLPALPAPASTAPAPQAPPPAPTNPPAPTPVAQVESPAVAPAVAAGGSPPPPTGFGAPAQPAVEPVKRTRSPRKPPQEAVQAAAQAAQAASVTAVAASTVAAQAAQAVATDPYAGQAAHVKVACDAAFSSGGAAARDQVYQSLTGRAYVEPAAAASAVVAQPPAVAPAPPPAAAPAAPANGFGAAAVAATAAATTAATAGQSLAARLAAKLGQPAPVQ